MPLPKYIVRLTDEERAYLEDLIHTGTRRAAATLIHARILLNEPPRESRRLLGLSHAAIADSVSC